MEFRRVDLKADSLASYQELMQLCFPHATKFTDHYFRWLYRDNPDGEVIGFDAWCDGRLAAHYVCVPTKVTINGCDVKALLSLNTATHPQFQGKGLFTQLAERTYDLATREGFDAVYGIANANSTPGFVRKLSFQLVESLKATIGVGGLGTDFSAAGSDVQFKRAWSGNSLAWRCANPSNPVSYRKGSRNAQYYASAMGSFVPVYAELPNSISANEPENNAHGIISPLRLFIGLVPESACKFQYYFDIPLRLRPSPLNFIYRSLSQRVRELEKGRVSLSFLDFDAY